MLGNRLFGSALDRRLARQNRIRNGGCLYRRPYIVDANDIGPGKN